MLVNQTNSSNLRIQHGREVAKTRHSLKKLPALKKVKVRRRHVMPTIVDERIGRSAVSRHFRCHSMPVITKVGGN